MHNNVKRNISSNIIQIEKHWIIEIGYEVYRNKASLRNRRYTSHRLIEEERLQRLPITYT